MGLCSNVGVSILCLVGCGREGSLWIQLCCQAILALAI